MSRENTNTALPAVVSPPAPSETRPALPQTRASSYLHSLYKADIPTSASVPSTESDWVSPFTLPHIPAFHRSRTTPASALKSPEQHKRSNSSLFYAAAWGSPYATPPSPQVRSPGLGGRSASKSLDSSGQPSPSRFRGHWLGSLSSKGASVAQYLYSPKQRAADGTNPSRNRSGSPGKDQSERPNWLSDSEGSDNEALAGEAAVKTPTRALFSKLRAGSFSKTLGHRSQESIVTVTPENFNAPPLTPQELKALSTTGISNMAAVGEMHERYSRMNGSPEKGKPLPLLPSGRTSSFAMEASASSPTSPKRPRMPSIQSFQRPKKQVLWKGKKCIIALPLQDRGEAGLPPPLSPTEVHERLHKWEADGFDIKGFVLGDGMDGESSRGTGHSRPVYPDPKETSRERQQRNFQISVPNQAEWDAWVEHLKEEKLRALGVTPSNSEAPTSTISPFSGSMSRTSSQYAGLTISPPNAPSSAASNPVRLGSNPFSSPFNPSTGVSSQAASIASPTQYASMPPQMHRYNQSTVQPGMQARMTSPFDPMTHGLRSPPSYFNQRSANVSPANIAGLPNLGEVLSPVSPFNVNDIIPPNTRSSILGQMHRQQPNNLYGQPVVLSSTPRNEPLSRPDLEIAHPTPRSHRHNLSQALQKGVDDAETSTTQRVETVSKTQGRAEDTVTSEETAQNDEEDDEETLPILKRPETLPDTDDNADIITNPSNEPSPLPRDERDPLANWPVTIKPQSDYLRGHKILPSVSKLNVKAPEFDPKGAFTSSNFSFGGNAFQPHVPKSAPFTSGSKSDIVQAPAPAPSSILKPDAPAFTPSFHIKPPPTTNAFTFGSATFNVEAPEFKPSLSSTENIKSSVGSSSEADEPATRIFGEVVIDPSSKAMRRSAKAVPIVRPRSKDGSQDKVGDQNDDTAEDTAEDEQGRPQAPVERQKRARRQDIDGDQAPIYAESAPFNHSRILSEIINDAESNHEARTETKTPSVDGWGSTPAEITRHIDESKENDQPASSQTGDSPTDRQSPFTFRDEGDAAKFDAARPSANHSRELSQSLTDIPKETDLDDGFARDGLLNTTELVDKDTATTQPKSVTEPGSAVSALAQPSEFKPAPVPRPVQEPLKEDSKQRKSLGLMASRYARSPSPSSTSSPSSPLQKVSSPPSELYSYIKPEDSSLLDLPISEELPIQSSPPRRRETVPSHEDEIIVEIDETGDEDEDRSESMSISGKSDHATGEAVPSYEEIDAVMRHFEKNPELSVERTETPPTQSTPLIDMRLPPNFRSDAPSPSPRRHQSTEHVDSDGHPGLRSPLHSFGLGIGVHKLTDGTEAVSDWNETLSPTQEDKLQSRARFFDGHVNDLVDGILETRLGPLEQSLKSIQESITAMTSRPRSGHGRRSMSTEVKHSDADDEDEYDAFEGYADYRARSPVTRKKDRPDRLKQAIMEAMIAYKPPAQETQPMDMSEIQATLAEMRELAQRTAPDTRQAELKSVVEDVIATHPRLRGQRFQQGQDSEEKVKLQLNGLETMLKVANERAEEEVKCRREVEDELADTRRRLRAAEEEAAQHRESSEEAERSLRAFVQEKAVYEDLEQTVSDLEQENKALKDTLEEHRESHHHWQDEIRKLKEKNQSLEHAVDVAQEIAKEQWHSEVSGIRMENEDLQHALSCARDQLHESTRSREARRDSVDRLRVEISNLVQTIAAERSEWMKSDHEMRVKHSTTTSSLEHERRRREKVEQELDDLHVDHHEILKLKTSHAHAQEEISRLGNLLAMAREESKLHQEKAFNKERELVVLKETSAAEVAKATTQLQADLERANSHLVNARADIEAQISRLQNRVDTAELDLEDQKAKHDAAISEATDKYSQALQEAAEKRENALQEQHADHQKKLNDLRERHTRALHNSSDDRHRLEHHLNEKLSLSDNKVTHLESKVTDLEERLEITKSAARAAVEAAMKKGIDLPTPAPSTVTSPPSHPSISFIKGTEIPEKISPQALRESIMVLQDQLQNREQEIEKLEHELEAVDKDAPKKIQGLETEIGWLRELLTVRVDDIDDLVNVLSEDGFDQTAAKDAAIRLKANLQMETQLKERAMSSSNSIGGLPTAISLSSIASLSSTLQSPRALPMAAAAAWGNWRKARDSSFGALSDLASGLGGSQTPSKNAATGSPGSFLSGIMTPPVTSFKSPPPISETSTPVPNRPLVGVSGPARRGGGEARPLRAYSSQPRRLNIGNVKGKEVDIPVTPTFTGRGEESESVQRISLGFGEDVDDDASPLDGRGDDW